jgi:hypothetical protein
MATCPLTRSTMLLCAALFLAAAMPADADIALEP